MICTIDESVTVSIWIEQVRISREKQYFCLTLISVETCGAQTVVEFWVADENWTKFWKSDKYFIRFKKQRYYFQNYTVKKFVASGMITWWI